MIDKTHSTEKNIRITEIQIHLLKSTIGLIADANFVLNDCFYIGNVGIHTMPDGNFKLIFPTKRIPSGKTVGCFRPITTIAGNIIRSKVITKYLNLIMDKEIKGVSNEKWNEEN